MHSAARRTLALTGLALACAIPGRAQGLNPVGLAERAWAQALKDCRDSVGSFSEASFWSGELFRAQSEAKELFELAARRADAAGMALHAAAYRLRIAQIMGPKAGKPLAAQVLRQMKARRLIVIDLSPVVGNPGDPREDWQMPMR